MSADKIEFLETLEAVIRERLATGDQSSYTARLVAAGLPRIAQKVGEEGVELALAAVTAERDAVLGEAADLVYHLLVLLNQTGLALADVTAELESRHRS